MEKVDLDLLQRTEVNAYAAGKIDERKRIIKIIETNYKEMNKQMHQFPQHKSDYGQRQDEIVLILSHIKGTTPIKIIEGLDSTDNQQST